MTISFAGTGKHVGEATTLPPSMYTDPAVFELEIERVFRHEWIAVARASQLPNPGDYLAVDLFGDPVALVRGADGELRALSNVCLHRSCPLVQGTGNTGSRITCPYHRWTYALDGRLGGAPLMDQAAGFSPDGMTLPQLRIEQWQGWVFVNAASDAPALAPRLTNLDALLDPFGLGGWEIATSQQWDSQWNWKIMVENFMESYHHTGPHRVTLDPLFPAAGTHALPVPGHFTLLENPPAHADSHGFWVMCVYPNTLIALTRGPDPHAFWYQMHIDAFDHFALTTHIIAPPARAADPEWTAQVSELLRTIHLEDIPVCEGVWHGVQSRYARAGRLSHLEQCIWYFHDYLRNALER